VIYKIGYVQHEVKIPDYWKVLSIGLRKGYPIFQRADVHIDINIPSSYWILNKVNGKFIHMNAEKMHFDDNKFDFVNACEFIHWVRHPGKVCEEIMRVGKSGYIESPNYARNLICSSNLSSKHIWQLSLEDGYLTFRPFKLQSISHDIKNKYGRFEDIRHNPSMFVSMFWEGSFNYKVYRK